MNDNYFLDIEYRWFDVLMCEGKDTLPKCRCRVERVYHSKIGVLASRPDAKTRSVSHQALKPAKLRTKGYSKLEFSTTISPLLQGLFSTLNTYIDCIC